MDQQQLDHEQQPSGRADETEASAQRGPLSGLRVIEFGHIIAGPFATRVLADLGAEIIKIEPPGHGDPARGWGLAIEGKSLWWPVHGRNKKCITLDLKSPEGREIALGLIATADAVIENFRPGQMERWGLSFATIHAANPRCMLVRISGYGQTGPYRDKVAFGVIGEAIGGLRHLTGYPPGVTDLPPVRTGVSLADSVAALYAAFGLMSAIYERDVVGTCVGRVIDVALYEAIFSLLEGCLPEYGKLGVVRQPLGPTLPTNAPSNAYFCRDRRWILIAGNSDRIFARLMALIGQPELARDPLYLTNWDRVENSASLDGIIGEWAAKQTADDAVAQLEASEVPASVIYTIADCAADPHFAARSMIQEVPDERFGTMLHPGVVPQFDSRPATIAWPGPALGAHNDEIMRRLLGLSEQRISELRERGVI